MRKIDGKNSQRGSGQSCFALRLLRFILVDHCLASKKRQHFGFIIDHEAVYQINGENEMCPKNLECLRLLS